MALRSFAALMCVWLACVAKAYEPTPENLAARQWFRDAGFGVFIHWGVSSVPGRGEWVMNIEKTPIAKYEPLADRFNPTGFEADAWCRLFKEAGARYVTITAKHHDGFCLWDTDETDWDIVDRTPYGRDVLKQLADSCRRHDLKLFFYYSQLDWHHPDYYPRGKTGRHSGRPEAGDFDRYIDYMNAQLEELLGGGYGDVAGVWFDGWWDQKVEGKPGESLIGWRLDETYGLIHRLNPACLVGSNHHLAPFPGEDFQMFEKDLPGENKGGFSGDAVVGELPLETCDTINNSWGYYEGHNRHKSPAELIGYLVRAAGTDANLLLNVGPKPDGTIDDASAERLRAIGAWLARYGGTVYGTRGGPIEPQPWGVATRSRDRVYVHVLDPPEAVGGWTTLAAAAELSGGEFVSYPEGEPVVSRRDGEGRLQVRLPDRAPDDPHAVLATALETTSP